MRFRDDKPQDIERAREAVRAWRDQHPDGTAEQLVTDLIGQFHPDYAVVLRGVLFAVNLEGAQINAGISIRETR